MNPEEKMAELRRQKREFDAEAKRAAFPSPNRSQRRAKVRGRNNRRGAR